MGVLLCLIGITNLAPLLAKLFTLPIIRGIQLGLGLLLAREGIRLILHHQDGPALASPIPVFSLLIALGSTAILLSLRKSARFPAALILLGTGLLVGMASHWSVLPPLDFGPLPLEFLHPRSVELKAALVALVLPQFALTFGNSIVATENTAEILYGAQARRVTTRALSLSIGVMNLFAGAIQAAPMCHGSGGITAHNKFGARSEKSSYVIGGVCLVLALFGHSALGLLGLIPMTVLGVFLIYVGIQHGSFVRDIVGKRAWLVIAVVVGLVSLITTNLTWGFLVGFALQGSHLAYVKCRGHLAREATPRPSL
ncbi:MAG: putative sulfate/molybdate transporter [Acidobacteriia bacterium]|nr:putative sulfate/molybdate transporter [Terriglobia bacterium]